MFIPKIYRSEDQELMRRIISENALGLFISDKVGIRATHSLFLWNDLDLLETHISNANPQAKLLTDGDEVLCDFLGAHSYISSSWYDHTNVSTWNYEAVQIKGKIRVMNDDELFQHLYRLTEKYEKHQQCPMNFEKMGRDFVLKEMKGAKGFLITPTEIHIADKFSQNRKDADYQNIIAHLELSPSQNEQKVAEKMKKNRPL